MVAGVLGRVSVLPNKALRQSLSPSCCCKFSNRTSRPIWKIIPLMSPTSKHANSFLSNTHIEDVAQKCNRCKDISLTKHSAMKDTYHKYKCLTRQIMPLVQASKRGHFASYPLVFSNIISHALEQIILSCLAPAYS